MVIMIIFQVTDTVYSTGDTVNNTMITLFSVHSETTSLKF